MLDCARLGRDPTRRETQGANESTADVTQSVTEQVGCDYYVESYGSEDQTRCRRINTELIDFGFKDLIALAGALSQAMDGTLRVRMRVRAGLLRRAACNAHGTAGVLNDRLREYEAIERCRSRRR